VAVWNLAAGKEAHTLKGTSRSMLRLAFSPDSKTLAAGCEDGKIKLLNLRDGKAEFAPLFHAGRVRCVAFSPDGKLFASGGEDKKVQVCDAASGRSLANLSMPHFVNNVAFSFDGRTLAGGCDHADGGVRLWDVGDWPRRRKRRFCPATRATFMACFQSGRPSVGYGKRRRHGALLGSEGRRQARLDHWTRAFRGPCPQCRLHARRPLPGHG